MTMSIVGTMRGGGAGVFYTDSFRAVFEDHIEYLRQNATEADSQNGPGVANSRAVIHAVSPEDAYWYRYRPYQYFSEKYGVEPQFHWYVLRASHLSAPEQFDETIREIVIPDWTFVQQLSSTHMTAFTSV